MITKFRAWDKVAEDIFIPEVLELDKYGKVTGIFSKGTMFSIEDFELLQSTGLFDKNGKEIFESYVVKVHAFFFDGCSESEKEHIGIIRYGNIAGFLIKEWYLETVDNKIAFLDLELHEESFEILGNEFEHPHLLEEDF